MPRKSPPPPLNLDALPDRLSDAAVEAILMQVGLPLQAPVARVADACRRELAVLGLFRVRHPARRSIGEIRAELVNVSELARQLERTIAGLGADTQAYLATQLCLPIETTPELPEVGTLSFDARHLNALAAARFVAWQLQALASHADHAAHALPSGPESSRWRELLDRRVIDVIAHALAPVFETAFGRAPSFKETPHGLTGWGPWADYLTLFWRQILGTDGDIPNLEAVLKDARRAERRAREDWPAMERESMRLRAEGVVSWPDEWDTTPDS